MVKPAIWTMMLLKLSAVKKFVALKLKKTTMNARPMTIGRIPRFPVLRLSYARRQSPACASTLVPFRETDPRCRDVDFRAHDASSGAVAGMPATLVGIPAVIACTISCCVVFSRS